jgi:5-hydroxyisourate hydrolase
VANRAPTISSHVLDTSRGAPAAGVRIELSVVGVDGLETAVGSSVTDAEGRVADLLGAPLSIGTYRLRFSMGELSPFFASLAVDVRVVDLERSYHVPLLLSPFGLSTYLGS